MKDEGIEITSRDAKIINLINDYGCIYKADIFNKFFLNSNRHRYRRMEKLKNYNVIIEEKKMLSLGAAGKEYIESNNGKIHYHNRRLNIGRKKYLADKYRILSIFSEDIKRIPLATFIDEFNEYTQQEDEVSNKRWMVGKVISVNNVEFVVYRIKRDNKRAIESQVKMYNNEWNYLNIENVVIVCEDKTTLDKYLAIKRDYKSAIKKELIVNLKDPWSITKCNKTINGYLDNEQIYLKNKEKIKCEGSYLIMKDYCVFNLCSSDYTYELKLQSFLNDNILKKIGILCFERDGNEIEEKYPQSKYKDKEILRIYADSLNLI